MFFTSKFKMDVAQTFREQDEVIRKLSLRVSDLEANAKKYGYRKEDGRPKRNVGRPRKEASK